MEYSEGAIREFLTELVSEALAESKSRLTVKFAQGRFVKTDPASVIFARQSTAADGSMKPPKEFKVIFSGDALATFVGAGPEQFGKLRAVVVETIRTQYRDFDLTDASTACSFLCLIDKVAPDPQVR